MSFMFDRSKFKFSDKYHCLSSQEIRSLAKKNVISGIEIDEEKIQPSSLDVTIGDEVYILEDTASIFPQNEEIYTSLLRIPESKRTKMRVDDGFEIRKDKKYLFKLNEYVNLDNEEQTIFRIKNSAKSTGGRYLLNSQALFDFTPVFDEAHLENSINKKIGMWLLTDSPRFNLIIKPGISLNQLRFWHGQNHSMSDQEIRNYLQKNEALLYEIKNNKMTPATHIVGENSIQIHWNLKGERSKGIIGLRARNNETAIDLRKGKNSHETLDYFDPIKASNGELEIKPGERYLLSSKEMFRLPNNIGMELRKNSHITFAGKVHDAGFVDNGFGLENYGENNEFFGSDLVYEVVSHENRTSFITDSTPAGRCEVFLTEPSDKVYGKEMGSSYNHQIGPKPAKHLSYDLDIITGAYSSLEKEILGIDAKSLNKFRNIVEGFETNLTSEQKSKLVEIIQNGIFHKKRNLEKDELLIQPIPYIILFDNNANVFTYVRANDLNNTGEKELFSKNSIGVGGHIELKDGTNYINKAMSRSIQNEVNIDGMAEYKFVGTLYQTDKPVDRQHLGLIHVGKVHGTITPKSKSIESASMVNLEDLLLKNNDNYETWSKSLIPNLPELYKIASQ